jgi:hypothetical protein
MVDRVAATIEDVERAIKAALPRSA